MYIVLLYCIASSVLLLLLCVPLYMKYKYCTCTLVSYTTASTGDWMGDVLCAHLLIPQYPFECWTNNKVICDCSFFTFLSIFLTITEVLLLEVRTNRSPLCINYWTLTFSVWPFKSVFLACSESTVWFKCTLRDSVFAFGYTFSGTVFSC